MPTPGREGIGSKEGWFGTHVTRPTVDIVERAKHGRTGQTAERQRVERGFHIGFEREEAPMPGFAVVALGRWGEPEYLPDDMANGFVLDARLDELQSDHAKPARHKIVLYLVLAIDF